MDAARIDALARRFYDAAPIDLFSRGTQTVLSFDEAAADDDALGYVAQLREFARIAIEDRDAEPNGEDDAVDEAIRAQREAAQ